MMLPPIPYMKEGLIGLICLLVAAVGVQTVRLNICKANYAAEQRMVEALELSVKHAGQQVLTLRASIDKQNKAIRAAELLGAQALAAQEVADRYARELALAEEKLKSALLEHAELKEMAANLTTCETYELVLRSIAGSLP